MQACQNPFGLAFGLGIGRALVELVRLFEGIERFEENLVDFCWRHAGFVLILRKLIACGLRTVIRCIRVQGHRILWVKGFDF